MPDETENNYEESRNNCIIVSRRFKTGTSRIKGQKRYRSSLCGQGDRKQETEEKGDLNYKDGQRDKMKIHVIWDRMPGTLNVS